MYNRTLILFLALPLMVAGCLDPRPEELTTTGTVDPSTLATSDFCASCHGTKGVNAAPPTGGKSPTDFHQAHVVAASTHAAISCSACHPMPKAIPDPAAPTHLDGAVEVFPSGLGGVAGATASYDAAKHTCAGVYCHGAQSSGGSTPTPTWVTMGEGPLPCDGCHGTPPTAGHPISNQCSKCHSTVVGADDKTIIAAALHVNGAADVSVSSCTSCHGMPPAAPHPQSTACATCHPAVINTDGSIKDWTLHDNGHADLGSIGCNQCHGSASGDPLVAAHQAPPSDTQGRSDATLPSVGAHQAHLVGSTLTGVTGPWHRTVQCNDCHRVPATLTSPGHRDGKADLVFGFAASNSASPAYDTTNHTCSGVHCHGAGGVAGATGDSPSWVAPTAITCGTSCHTLPPGGIHPDRTDCEACHHEWDGTKFVKPEQHINGKVDYL